MNSVKKIHSCAFNCQTINIFSAIILFICRFQPSIWPRLGVWPERTCPKRIPLSNLRKWHRLAASAYQLAAFVASSPVRCTCVCVCEL